MRKYAGHQQQSRRGLTIGAVIVAAVVFLLVSLLIFRPRIFQAVGFSTMRAVNTFSHYVLKSKPHFYALDMEKNGKDFRVDAGNMLEINYRDEFVVKSVVSDDLSGKSTRALIDGTGREGNHVGVLFHGIDFVNNIMRSDASGKSAQADNVYKVVVYYQNEIMAVVPIRVIIAPQDWLRHAQDASNVNEQIGYLKKAVAQNSQDAGVRRILAAIYLKQNRTNEAALLYADILRIQPGDTAAMKDLARCYLTSHRHAKAFEILLNLVKINGRDAEAYAMLGLSSGLQDLWDKAVQYYAQSVKIDPENHAVRLLLAQACEKAGKTGAALEQYQYLAGHAPDPATAWRAQGDIYLAGKRYDQAVENYKKAIKSNPKDAAAYANLATACAGQGKLKEEMENLQKAVALLPDDPVIHFNLAAAYERRNRTNDAIREYSYVLKKNPGDVDALERSADLAFKNKQYAQAVQSYEKLGGKYPQKADMFANMGFAYGELKQYAASAKNYEKAIKLGAKNQTMYNNLAFTYMKLGKEKEAVALYEKVLPQNKKTISAIADHYVKTKKYPQAIKYYQKIVKLEPKKASSYFGLGYAYAAGKNWDKAIENFLTALKYDREDDEIYANLGDAYENKGLYQEALRAYRNAYEINPETPVAARIPRLRIQLLQKNN